MNDAANARSANRNGNAPTTRNPNIGFRVVRPAPNPPPVTGGEQAIRRRRPRPPDPAPAFS